MAGLFAEFRQLFKELGDVGTIKRRAGALVLPVSSVSGVTVVGLCLHKHVIAPDIGPSAAPEEKQIVPTIEKHAKIELPSDVAEKVRAVARIGCPVEIDCLRALRAGADFPGAVEDLLPIWEGAGYFKEESTERTIDTLLMDSKTEKFTYGKDIYCEVPTQKAFDGEFVTWDEKSVQRGLDILEDLGYLIVPQTVSKDIIKRVRDTLGGGLNLRSNTFEITSYNGPEVQCDLQTPSLGRRHFLVRENTSLVPELNALYASITPLIQAYLSKHRSQTKPYLSEMQVVVTDPLSVDQFWHRDNITPGLTVIIPLTPVPHAIGLTNMLPYSHRNGLNSIVGETATPLRIGDALMYDARILHRGTKNETYNRTRVAVVFRFDFEPPPGQGFTMTAINAMLGRILSGLGKIRNLIP